jgi:predicted DNA-binding transcriptional regulator AlpA
MPTDATLLSLPALLHVEHIAELTGYARNSITRFAKRGMLPAPIRMNPRGKLLWPRDEFLAWLNGRRAVATEATPAQEGTSHAAEANV